MAQFDRLYKTSYQSVIVHTAPSLGVENTVTLKCTVQQTAQ